MVAVLGGKVHMHFQKGAGLRCQRENLASAKHAVGLAIRDDSKRYSQIVTLMWNDESVTMSNWLQYLNMF